MQKTTYELTQQQLAALASALIFMAFVLFMAGYYWGRRSIMNQFSEQLQQESFADKIYSSMVTLYDIPEEVRDAVPLDVGPHEESTKLDIQSGTVTGEAQPEVFSSDGSSPDGSSSEASEQERILPTRYYAALIGFGTCSAAHIYARKLQERDIPVRVIQRESKTARGKKRLWFQVVTEPMEKEKLEDIVQHLSVRDALSGIEVVEYKEDTRS